METGFRLGSRTRPPLVSMDRISKRANSFHESVARRAFQLFQNRGRVPGHDVDDWRCAEAELLHSAHIEAAELDGVLMVRAEVAGFRASELEVGIEPRRLFITGERVARSHPAGRKLLYRDGCAEKLFRVLPLAVEVDPSHATAELREGILEVLIPTLAFSNGLALGAKKHWLVRATDYQARAAADRDSTGTAK
jgi:HSP20 family molecular chaperone IbpA